MISSLRGHVWIGHDEDLFFGLASTLCERRFYGSNERNNLDYLVCGVSSSIADGVWLARMHGAVAMTFCKLIYAAVMFLIHNILICLKEIKYNPFGS